MTDIVEWLRSPSGDIFPRCREAADDIEKLRRQVKSRDYEIGALERENERLRTGTNTWRGKLWPAGNNREGD